MNKRKIIKWLCLLIWMVVIFLFSNQPHSGQATQSLIEKIIPTIKDPEQIELINLIIRKIAHFTEYFILTLLMYSLLKEYKINNKKIVLYSILFCLFYAITDEWHQLYIAGRTANIKDCIIDTTGGIFFIIINKLISNKKNHQNNFFMKKK